MSAERVFERMVTCAILLNVFVFGWGLVDADNRELAEHVESLILLVFVVEIVWRLRRRGWGFFRSGWNVFDILVVAAALLPVLGIGMDTSVLRLARLGRAARLLHLGRHGVTHLRLWRLARVHAAQQALAG